MQSGRRDHLVHIARKLFYENGFHAVGIDRILAELVFLKPHFTSIFTQKMLWWPPH